jgi:hypothetical protein
MMSLQAPDGQEIVASAVRCGGVAAMVFRGEDEKHILSTFTFNGLDVVDLCSLGKETAPEAAAALGRDGTLVLFRDVLRDRQPGTVKYQSVKGTAYRLLSARGYLFLLTSEALYVIAGLVDRFLTAAEDTVTPVLVIPMEAVDAGLGGDRWLWIVVPDGVLRLDIELLDHLSPTGVERRELKDELPMIITPEWREQQVEQSSRALALAV